MFKRLTATSAVLWFVIMFMTINSVTVFITTDAVCCKFTLLLMPTGETQGHT